LGYPVQRRSALKITHITPAFYPAWAYGGIPRSVHDLSRSQARLGHEISVITTDAFDASSRVVADQSPVVIEGVKAYYIKNVSNRIAFSKRFFLPSGMTQDSIKALCNSDLIHLHGHRNVLNHIAHRYAVREKIPYVFSAHGSMPREFGRELAKRAYDLLLGGPLLEGASLYLALSDAERRHYTEAGLDESRIRVIHEGIPVEEFRHLPERGDFRNSLGIPADLRIVLFLGTVEPRKGVDILVKAVGMLKRHDVLLVIAGTADSGVLSSLKGLVVRSEIQDRVVFTGLLTDFRSLSAYRDADVTVYATEDEAFGLVPFESIMCGTPAIVSDDSGACEVISRAGAGDPVEYGNVIELAGAISGILDDRRRAKNLVDRGRLFIEHELSWEVLAPKYLDACASCARNRHGA
jgi:glycosyltransferase involved in cell wall biosynthesis